MLAVYYILDVSSAYYACLRFRVLICTYYVLYVLRALLRWAGLDCVVVAMCGDKLGFLTRLSAERASRMRLLPLPEQWVPGREALFLGLLVLACVVVL